MANPRACTINSELFRVFLFEQGFTEEPNADIDGHEVVFIKAYEAQPKLIVKVYSSIRVGKDIARGVGEDAIRVVAILNNGAKTYGIGKFPRVYRTGSQEKVHSRVMVRVGEAFKRCEGWLEEQKAKALTAPPKPIAAAPSADLPTITGAWVGDVGRQSVRLVGMKVVGRLQYTNKRFCFTFRDNMGEGNTYVFWTPNDVLKPHATYDLTCKIKSHNVFKGTRQTEITEASGKLTS